MLTFKHVNLKLNISKWNLTLSDQASNRDCEMGGALFDMEMQRDRVIYRVNFPIWGGITIQFYFFIKNFERG